MKGTLISLALLLLGANAMPKMPEHVARIVNGDIAVESKHACLVMSGNSGEVNVALGGGSIISSRHILTSAHMVVGFTEFHIIYGNVVPQSGRYILASLAIPHTLYDAATRSNDIAIIVVPAANPINTGFGIPIAVAQNADTLTGTGTVLGFGFTKPAMGTASEQLYEASITIATTCENATETHFCGSPTAANAEQTLCPGDNGAGVFVVGDIEDEEVPEEVFDIIENESTFERVKGRASGDVLIGIASRIPTACDGTGTVLYTAVYLYNDWITQSIS